MVKNQINTLYLWVWMLLKLGLQHYYEASLEEKKDGSSLQLELDCAFHRQMCLGSRKDELKPSMPAAPQNGSKCPCLQQQRHL